MGTDKKNLEELLVAAEPLIKWLNENCHPHCNVVVTQTSATLNEDQLRATTFEFVKD